MAKSVIYFFCFIIVMSLLFIGVSMLGILVKSRFSGEKIAAVILKYRGIRGKIVAAVIGVITPFCSCTTVPIFGALVGSNIGCGTAISFLISSPSINIPAFILLLTLLGPRTAFIYIAACFLFAVAGGLIFDLFFHKNPIRDNFISIFEKEEEFTIGGAFKFSMKSLRYFLPVFLLAAAIGTCIYNYIPPGLLVKLTANNSILAVPIAVAIGSLIYSDIILLIPVGYALILKGVNQGIVLGFLISASSLSIPGMIMLSRIIKPVHLFSLIGMLLILYTGLGLIYYFI